MRDSFTPAQLQLCGAVYLLNISISSVLNTTGFDIANHRRSSKLHHKRFYEHAVQNGRSVQRIAVRCRLEGSGYENPFNTPAQTRSGAHPASCKIDTRGVFFFLREVGQGVALTTNPILRRG